MAKQRKLPKKNVLRNKADQLWSYAVKDDWSWRCAVCREQAIDKLNSHHLIPKSRSSAHRYTLQNGICLCQSHHLFDPYCSPHSDGGEIGWVEWLREHHPQLITFVMDHQHDTLSTSSVSQGWYFDQICRLSDHVDSIVAEEICGPRLIERIHAARPF